MPKWKLVIEYQGTRYRGWQEQANARTVQGELRKALENVFGERLEIVGAGRTDGGVHALNQVAHVRSRHPRAPANVLNHINDQLPSDINLRSIVQTAPEFHARHDAVERFYLYQIATRRRAFTKPFVWWIKDQLDVPAMQNAVRALPGRHDFASFCEKGGDPSSTLVEVTCTELSVHGELILFRIGASHYLWKMVRRIVGVLVEVGRGNLAKEDVAQFLVDKTSAVAQWTAPPSGLFLECVRYRGESPPDPPGPAFFFR
jgi:tRNA pseudouridine38-40 synthase